MATALELTRKGWQSYLQERRRRPQEPARAETHQDEYDRLFDLIRKAAHVLKTRFGARRVILFGSLGRTKEPIAPSDVDLAVEGVTGDDYWDAWRAVEDIITDRPVDLVDMETVGESVLRAIQRYGTEL
jgi:predicted nucleotidyltransferase